MPAVAESQDWRRAKQDRDRGEVSAQRRFRQLRKKKERCAVLRRSALDFDHKYDAQYSCARQLRAVS
jgi:hypothetical protein